MESITFSDLQDSFTVLVDKEGILAGREGGHLVDSVCAEVLHFKVMISRIDVVDDRPVTSSYYRRTILRLNTGQLREKCSDICDLRSPKSLFIVAILVVWVHTFLRRTLLLLDFTKDF